MINKKLSIIDIANHFKISKTTVSFILNGRAKEKRISDEMVEKVLRFVEEVGYKPNSLAKSLRTGKSNTIGLMVENIADNFFANIARFIEDHAYKNGYKIIYCSTDNNAAKAKDLISMFRDRHVDGYIIAPPVGIETEIAGLIDDGLPVVLFDRFLPDVDSCYVVTDNLNATYNATRHFIDGGYKNIAFITFELPQTQMQGRVDGYKKALKEHKLHPHIKKVAFNEDARFIIEPIKEFLKGKRFDAILFGTNRIGICGLKVLKQLNLKIPDDVAIISFDDNEVFELYSPPITAISQPIEEIADNIITILLNKLNHRDDITKNEQIVLNNKLIIRQSFR